MKVQIRFESDWRIGSGTGIPGSLDDLVQRDQDGLPYLPAKTVKGMLRDGCERVAEALGGSWPAVVDGLFGTDTHSKSDPGEANHPSRLVIRRARLPLPVRNALRGPDNHALREALTFVMPHVAIDPETGTAKEDHLFHVEVARGGAELESSVEPVTDLTQAQTALLHAGAAAVRRMGGKRRRGLGRCTLQVTDAASPPGGARDWLEWLEASHRSADLSASIEPAARVQPPGSPEDGGGQDPEQPGADAERGAGPASEEAGESEDWSVFWFSLEAVTPLCLPRRTVGNLVESLDHVPGTLLLPWLHRALKHCGVEAGPLIQSGGALVTPAYPCQPDGSPSWPVPQSLHREKGSAGLEDPEERIFNLLRQEPEGSVQPKPYRVGYVQADTGPGVRPTYVAPERGVAMHNTVDDERQRPTEEVGGVFSFEVVPAGTRFSGEVRIDRSRCPGGQNGEALRAALQREAEGYAVGRAKQDEYGQVRIEVSEGRDREPDGPRPLGGSGEGGTETPETLTVWLLSDALLRDEWLGWGASPEDLRGHLEEALQVRLRPREGSWAFSRARRMEGWVRAWNLPRPSVTGLVAGSCFRFSVEKAPPDLAERIERLHIAGVGERRAEGYGQIRIGAPLLEAGELPGNKSTAGAGADEGAAVPADTPYLRLIEREAWKEAIREAALGVAEEDSPLGMEPKGKPPNSQIGALRSVFVGLGTETVTREEVLARLVHLRATRNRADKWPDGVLAGLMELLDWSPGEDPDWIALDEALRSEDSEKRTEGFGELSRAEGFEFRRALIWEKLFGEDGAEPLWPPTATPEGASRLAENLWPYAVSTLITTACAEVFHRRDVGRLEKESDGAAVG